MPSMVSSMPERPAYGLTSCPPGLRPLLGCMAVNAPQRYGMWQIFSLILRLALPCWQWIGLRVQKWNC